MDPLGVFEGVGADFGDEKAPMFGEGIDININIQTYGIIMRALNNKS